MAYRAKDNRREVLIPADKLVDPTSGTYISPEKVIWSADNSKALIFTNTKKVWRYNTRGDYWILDLKSGMFRQLGPDCRNLHLCLQNSLPTLLVWLM